MADGEHRRTISPAVSYRPIVKGLLWDIVLNATIPAACYYFSKRFISPSELTALIIATAFPLLKSIYDLIRRHELDPVSVLVLLGVTTSIVALSLGGDPRLLLVRESFFTGAFGMACFVSLALPRPIMFYFGRFFMAGNDPQRRAAYNARWQNPFMRHGVRFITAIWGTISVGEFLLRAYMAFTLPPPAVLSVSPFLTGVATIFAIVWTFLYAHKIRERIASMSTNRESPPLSTETAPVPPHPGHPESREGRDASSDVRPDVW